MPGDGSLDELLSSLGDKERMSFLGFLSAKAEGMSDLIDAKSQKKFSRLASKLGIVPGLSVASYRPMTQSLSLWHGTGVAAY